MTSFCRSRASVVSLLGEPADEDVPEVDDPMLAECTRIHLRTAPVLGETGAADADEMFDGDGDCGRVFGVSAMPAGSCPTGKGWRAGAFAAGEAFEVVACAAADAVDVGVEGCCMLEALPDARDDARDALAPRPLHPPGGHGPAFICTARLAACAAAAACPGGGPGGGGGGIIAAMLPRGVADLTDAAGDAALLKTAGIVDMQSEKPRGG